MTRAKPCKWCVQGVPRYGNDHWLVKSITPSRINIYACTAGAKGLGADG